MSITITLPLGALSDPLTAAALRDLLLALGHHDSTDTAAPPPVAAADPDSDWLDRFPDRPRRFLELIRSHGLLTISQAMTGMEIAVPKAVGGLTGAIGRWAPAAGIAVPYEAIDYRGERAWRWIGFSAQSTSTGSNGRASRTRRSRPSAGNGNGNGSDSEEPYERRFDGFLAALPEPSRRFMDVLRDRRTLTMREALDEFGYARAQALTGIIEPVVRLAKKHGIGAPFEAGVNEVGDRTWAWPGHGERSPNEPELPAEPAQIDRDAPRSSNPGVRIRRRAATV